MSQPSQPNTITLNAAARVIKLSPAELSRLSDEGVIPSVGKDAYSLGPLIHSYIDHLKAEQTRLATRPTQAEIGAHLDLSDRSIRELANLWGINSKDLPLAEWRVRYIRALREQAAGRAATGDLDLATERARLASAQADRVEMLNAEKRRELAPLALIEEVLAKVGARVARILDTIPGTIRRREPSLSAETISTIAGDIAKARNEAAGISLADLQRDDDQPDQASADADADATDSSQAEEGTTA